MEAIDRVNKLPEVKAKIYAEAFGFSKSKVNDMCAAKDIPCRKLGTPSKDGNTDNRPWLVNMVEIRKQLDSANKIDTHTDE